MMLCKNNETEAVMARERIFEDEALEALRRKFFPRVPWTEAGPVRRHYFARAARDGQTVAQTLEALAIAEGFIGPGLQAITGDGAACLEAFRRRGQTDILVFGLGLDACWCDFAFGPVDGEGWQEVLVRSEEAENLTALAHAVGAVRFRKA